MNTEDNSENQSTTNLHGEADDIGPSSSDCTAPQAPSRAAEGADLIALLGHAWLRGPTELLTGRLYDEFISCEHDITRLLTFIARVDRRILVRQRSARTTTASSTSVNNSMQVEDCSAVTLRQYHPLGNDAQSLPATPSTYEDALGVVRQCIENIDRAVTFLRKIRTQAEMSRSQHDHCIRQLLHRIAMMDERHSSSANASSTANTKEVDCFDFSQSLHIIDFMLYEYLTRHGLLRTAEMLRTTYNLEELLDKELYEKVESTAQAIRRNELGPALEFCRRHRKRLSALQSPCEAELHLQKFLNLLNDGQVQDAVLFSAKDLLSRPHFIEYCPDIKKAQALVVFSPATVPDDLKHFLNTEDRCKRLEDIFRKTTASVFGTLEPTTFEVLVMFGLSAISFTSCRRCVSPSCPTCHPLFRDYVAQLPLPHHCRSYVRCPLTGRPTSDEDMPMSSPAGFVYSESGLDQIKRSASPEESSEHSIKCHLSGEVFRASKFERIFLP